MSLTCWEACLWPLWFAETQFSHSPMTLSERGHHLTSSSKHSSCLLCITFPWGGCYLYPLGYFRMFMEDAHGIYSKTLDGLISLHYAHKTQEMVLLRRVGSDILWHLMLSLPSSTMNNWSKSILKFWTTQIQNELLTQASQPNHLLFLFDFILFATPIMTQWKILYSGLFCHRAGCSKCLYLCHFFLSVKGRVDLHDVMACQFG